MGILGNLVPANSKSSNDSGTGAKPSELSDANFIDQTKQGITFIDFWAEWCGPCKMVSPLIDKLAQKWQGKVNFAKLNIDDNPATPGRYGILSIPTFYIIVNGEVKAQLVGSGNEQTFEKFISDAYNKYAAKDNTDQIVQ